MLWTDCLESKKLSNDGIVKCKDDAFKESSIFFCLCWSVDLLGDLQGESIFFTAETGESPPICAQVLSHRQDRKLELNESFLFLISRLSRSKASSAGLLISKSDTCFCISISRGDTTIVRIILIEAFVGPDYCGYEVKSPWAHVGLTPKLCLITGISLTHLQLVVKFHWGMTEDGIKDALLHGSEKHLLIPK